MMMYPHDMEGPLICVEGNAMPPKLVFPLKIVVPEECVAGGTRVVVGSGLKG
jgi:hypothetical protein